MNRVSCSKPTPHHLPAASLAWRMLTANSQVRTLRVQWRRPMSPGTLFAWCTQLRNLLYSQSHEIATIKHYSSNIPIGSNPSLLVEARGRDSSVGIATRYGLDGPGIESRVGARFSANDKPDLGAIQPSIQGVPGLSRGLALTTHPIKRRG
jgi:hypothetical protein